MSKEELLKYLIAEIDLIMHDKDYRFENANGTWYSRESCRDLTNEEVFEELRAELRQFADLEAKLAESENQCRECKHLNKKIELNIKNKLMAETQQLKQQLAEKEKEIEYQESMKILAVENQNKKAIEQLEKVKEIINKNYFYNLSNDSCTFDKLEVDFRINNQIKQLREMK